MKTVSEVKRLPDEAIHFSYYKNRASHERSEAINSGISFVKQLIWNKLNSNIPNFPKPH